MITVVEALDIINSNAKDFGTEEINLSDSIHRILKEDWYSDRDLPPYNRVTMDGIAIQYQAFEKGLRTFPIEGVAAAGALQMTLQNPLACLEVMTGSVLPHNLDTVIRYEDLHIENGEATIQVDQLTEAQNVHFKGEDRKSGDLVIPKNTRISPAEVGVGASIGKSKVKVGKLPRIMVISTGDELVNITEQPAAHQIRRSNVYRLITTLKAYNIDANSDHINDKPEEILKKLKEFLEDYDVIILSGGVSKGKFDYIPSILEELKVEKLFHKIKQRPGKPFWFGKYKDQCTIFALPGNPVSSFLCMQRYFLSWLEQSLVGARSARPHAILQADVLFKPDLTYFLEVKISYNNQGQILANPQKGNGSGDLANLVDADAFIELPRGRNEFKQGEIFPIFFYR